MPVYSCFPTHTYVDSNSNYRQTMQAHLPSSNICTEGTLLGALQGSSEKVTHSKSSCPINKACTGLSLDTLNILGKSSWIAAEAYLAARWWPQLLHCISAMPCPSSMVLIATRWPFCACTLHNSNDKNGHFCC